MATKIGHNSYVVAPDEGAGYWQPQPTGGYALVKLTPELTGFERYSVGFQIFEPGTAVKRHAHEENHEFIFVFEGRGQVTIGEETVPLIPGGIVFVGPGTFHHLENTGDSPLRTLWVFSPPGLEHWFEAIGQPRAVGESAPEPFQRPGNAHRIQDDIGILRDTREHEVGVSPASESAEVESGHE